MKKIISAVCFFLFLFSCALAQGVPDDQIRDAVLSLAWEDDGGEKWIEGHVVLGTEETEGEERVYLLAQCCNYGFLGGVFTDSGAGFSEPMTLCFTKTENAYTLSKILQPEDGDGFDESLKQLMPADCLTRMTSLSSINESAIASEMTDQAKAYLQTIGRTEPVEDWRTLDLKTADILTPVSNLTISLCGPYPLWVTTAERVENGERYLYSREWTPDASSPDTRTYLTPDGKTNEVSGRTGTETLTKVRRTDNHVMETIIIKAQQDDLSITLSDDNGQKDYQLTWDGLEYRLAQKTQTGNCLVSYPSFEDGLN